LNNVAGNLNRNDAVNYYREAGWLGTGDDLKREF